MCYNDRPMGLPVKRLLAWFDRNRRDLPWRRRRTIYSTWVSEVMLQQTRVNAVKPYFRRFIRRFPSVRALAAAEPGEVLKMWEGMGYYARARNLLHAARIIMDEYDGLVPCDYGSFRRLPGAGPYITAAVLSMACGQVLPVVDGNVLRVVCRFRGIGSDIRKPETRARITAYLQKTIPPDMPGRFNEAMMELGALVCLSRKPLCAQCPLQGDCRAARLGKTAVLPFRSKKPPVPFYDVALALLVKEGRIFVQKRPEKGHLGGLWEFPGGKLRAGESAEGALVRECREELGIAVQIDAKIAEVSHAYTHFRIRIHLFACSTGAKRIKALQEWRWVFPGDLDLLPFPAANHKLFPAIRKYLHRNG